jgi:protein-tyrosine phosphatase/nicotinamidase-related amidase/aminoglycoside phosphotransferase (APT) family kinase protein
VRLPTVLITQCLQRDFVDPIGPHDPLPNLLHVGHAESTRLLGPNPAEGPLAQLIQWARAQPAESLDIVHVRDWHDAEDPAQREHLQRFGQHCIGGSPGARLVLGIDDHISTSANEQIVDSRTLNDLHGTELVARLEAIRRAHGDEPIRVGVVGVWTEAKVSFLLYELKTRLGIDELATCSALTASASRSQHFNALSQLERILGVRCFESLAEFVDWLHPGSELALPRHAEIYEPDITVSSQDGPLDASDRAIVAHLFRDSTHVDLDELSGGYSGSLVWRADSRDALGHRQAPSVVKIGTNKLIAQERVAFEKIEEVLGNSAPRVRGFIDVGDRAGLKYSYAAIGQGRVRTLKALFTAGESTDDLAAIVHTTFEEILGPLYAAACYERLPLFEHYQFSADLAGPVRSNVAALTTDVDQDEIRFPGGLVLPNVCRFYEEFLTDHPLPTYDYHYVSYVHGDLNAANILVDEHQNVWVIDFFHSGRGHVLKDLAKFENDLLYLLTPMETESEFEDAVAIVSVLTAVRDLRAPLPARVEDIRSPHVLRAWELIRILRRIGGELCHDDRDPLQIQIALLRYAVHTLSFDEASRLQKLAALAASCWLANEVARTVRANEALRVDWVESELLQGPGRLGITLCPGRRDRGRDLVRDVADLAEAGTDHVVALMTDAELEWAGASELGTRVVDAGITFRRLPVPDQGTPQLAEAAQLTAWCLEAVARGDQVVVTCMGGLGRSGTVVACCLVRAGAEPDVAIAAVRAARGPRALETVVQEDFVRGFARRGV